MQFFKPPKDRLGGDEEDDDSDSDEEDVEDMEDDALRDELKERCVLFSFLFFSSVPPVMSGACFLPLQAKAGTKVLFDGR